MGHTHNFQSSGWGCQILPWSWDSKSRLIGISQGDRYKRVVSSENQVWEGQNGAMRRRRALLTFTLHSTAGISFIGRNAYRLTFGHRWANASMPRVIGKLRENQSGHWDDSWEAKRTTSALPNRSQIWDTVWRFNIHSPGLSFCLDRKSAAWFSIPGTWTALKERNLSWDQRRRRRANLSRVRDREPPWWFMWDTTAILSVLTMIWCPPRTGRKYMKARKTALSSRQFMCQERNSPVHSPLAGLHSKTVPQPVIDASTVIIWRRWIAPILTPLWRKAGSRHCKRGREQLRDTLIRQVAGTVGCNLSSFIHQRNGLMWSNPRGNTGEAAAMRPSSLRQVPTDTWQPSLKQAKHAVKWISGQEQKGPAPEWNPNEPPETWFAEMGGAHSYWHSFWGQENGCGGERYLCDDLLAPWSEPEWASRPDSSAHECLGASKGPVQHPCILWMFSAPRPGRRAGPCIGKPSLQRQTEGTSYVAERPKCENMHPLGR